jgi:hypothetical protein
MGEFAPEMVATRPGGSMLKMTADLQTAVRNLAEQLAGCFQNVYERPYNFDSHCDRLRYAQCVSEAIVAGIKAALDGEMVHTGPDWSDEQCCIAGEVNQLAKYRLMK